MGVVRLNEQQLLLLEKIVEKLEHMSEILDEMQQNSKRMQESLAQWLDQEDEEEEVAESVEDGTKDTVEEENIPVEAIIHTTIRGNLREITLDHNKIPNGNTLVTIQNAMEMDQLIEVTMRVYSNQIFLLPFYVQPQIRSPRMFFTGKKWNSPFTVLNLINSSIFMSIFKGIPEDLNHPPSLLDKLVTGFWNFDPGIRTVVADQRLLRLTLEGMSDFKAEKLQMDGLLIIDMGAKSKDPNDLFQSPSSMQNQRPQQQQSSKLLSLPTILALGRIATVSLLISTFYVDSWWGPIATTSIFISAASTDWLDGYLARKMMLGSIFGAFLDPVNDKLIVVATLVLLCMRPVEVPMFGQVPWLSVVLSILQTGKKLFDHYLFDILPLKVVFKPFDREGEINLKSKVPFHISSIWRPQEEFSIMVNNSNQPLEHIWLQRSEDGQGCIHSLENLSVLDFVDKDIANVNTVKPPPLESTPFTLMEEMKYLKELAAKLRGVNVLKVALDPVIMDALDGFLFEWWSIFWDILITGTNEKHLKLAATYIEESMKHDNPMVFTPNCLIFCPLSSFLHLLIGEDQGMMENFLGSVERFVSIVYCIWWEFLVVQRTFSHMRVLHMLMPITRW